jgi:hypothetical protein
MVEFERIRTCPVKRYRHYADQWLMKPLGWIYYEVTDVDCEAPFTALIEENWSMMVNDMKKLGEPLPTRRPRFVKPEECGCMYWDKKLKRCVYEEATREDDK